MLLRRSGDRTQTAFNLGKLTNTSSLNIGIANEVTLLALVEAVIMGSPAAIQTARETAFNELGEQATLDAIAVIAGFNGITKIANGTGLPLDPETRDSTVTMRTETLIDQYSESNKFQTWG
jgi:alkylhydroperoxidase family enzyme